MPRHQRAWCCVPELQNLLAQHSRGAKDCPVSPLFMVDGEPLFGADKLELAEDLASSSRLAALRQESARYHASLLTTSSPYG